MLSPPIKISKNHSYAAGYVSPATFVSPFSNMAGFNNVDKKVELTEISSETGSTLYASNIAASGRHVSDPTAAFTGPAKIGSF
jgi:hypothetical protein